MTEITAPVTDELELPAFLQRNSDGSFKHPELWNTTPTIATNLINEQQGLSEAICPAGMPIELTQKQQQAPKEPHDQSPDPYAVFAERKKLKSNGRVAKMKAKFAERDAREAGKVWDAQRGGWRDPK